MSEPAPPSHRGSSPFVWVALTLTSLAAVIAGGLAVTDALQPPPATTSVVVERATPSLLVAIRDLSRLETAEVHVEKVIDLKDKQSRLFGLVESEDALLLVAVGHATVGVDLSALREGDVAFDEESRRATITLPPPEVLGATLDEESTYVHRRDTDLLAKRNERLEGEARKRAVEAIEKAASTEDVLGRARASAEKQLEALARSLGAREVDVRWRDR